MEALSMLAALGLMLCAVVFKVFSAGVINRMKMGIAGVEQEKQGFLNQLKAAQATTPGGDEESEDERTEADETEEDGRPAARASGSHRWRGGRDRTIWRDARLETALEGSGRAL